MVDFKTLAVIFLEHAPKASTQLCVDLRPCDRSLMEKQGVFGFGCIVYSMLKVYWEVIMS